MTRPKPEIIAITKKKLHNVLQGVAPPDLCLDDTDKKLFLDWSRENLERYWLHDPIKYSDVVVIDDPQGNNNNLYGFYPPPI